MHTRPWDNSLGIVLHTVLGQVKNSDPMGV